MKADYLPPLLHLKEMSTVEMEQMRADFLRELAGLKSHGLITMPAGWKLHAIEAIQELDGVEADTPHIVAEEQTSVPPL